MTARHRDDRMRQMLFALKVLLAHIKHWLLHCLAEVDKLNRLSHTRRVAVANRT